MATQYILAGIAAAGIAFFIDFKIWQSSGACENLQTFKILA
jgi:hypothetical protein